MTLMSHGGVVAAAAAAAQGTHISMDFVRRFLSESCMGWGVLAAFCSNFVEGPLVVGIKILNKLSVQIGNADCVNNWVRGATHGTHTHSVTHTSSAVAALHTAAASFALQRVDLIPHPPLRFLQPPRMATVVNLRQSKRTGNHPLTLLAYSRGVQ